MTRALNTPAITDLRDVRDAILRIAADHGASNIRVIGSVARGDAIPESDFDFLVDFDHNARGFAYFGRMDELRITLEQLLGRHVDIVDSGGLKQNARIRERILQEAVPL